MVAVFEKKSTQAVGPETNTPGGTVALWRVEGMVREGNKELCHFLSASACPLLGSAFMVRIQKSVFVKPALTKICCAENEHTNMEP